MAITKSIDDTNYGYVFEEAYLRIGEVMIRPYHDEVRIDLRGYADANARDSLDRFDEMKAAFKKAHNDSEEEDFKIKEMTEALGKKPIGIYRDIILLTFNKFCEYCTEFSKDKILAGAYTYVKTLDKYKESIDN